MRLHAAGRFVAVLGVTMSLHLHLEAQISSSGPDQVGPQARIGLTYVGVDTEVGPTAAAELTYLGSTPRIWRAGLIAGLFTTTRGAVYGYGGLHLPLPLPFGILARPSFSIGLYEKGRGMELGHVLEFRSSFVLEREIGERVSVSAMLYHLSNAGLGFKNPGLEAVGLAVAVPVFGGGPPR